MHNITITNTGSMQGVAVGPGSVAVSGAIQQPRRLDVLLALDLETTGLDPATGRILEVGWLCATESRDDSCPITIHLEGSFICGRPSALSLLTPGARALHEESGLIEAVETANVSPNAADDAWDGLQSFVAYWRNTGDVTLLGFNPSFDRDWLRHWRPEIADLLHYRMLDVGVLRRLGYRAEDRPGARRHRALDDAYAALDTYALALAEARHRARAPAWGVDQ